MSVAKKLSAVALSQQLPRRLNAAGDAEGVELPLAVAARVLASTIGMKDEAAWWQPSADGHRQRVAKAACLIKNVERESSNDSSSVEKRRIV